MGLCAVVLFLKFFFVCIGHRDNVLAISSLCSGVKEYGTKRAHDLPNAQVETFSDGEESNEHTATLTETEAGKEASNTAGEGTLF